MQLKLIPLLSLAVASVHGTFIFTFAGSCKCPDTTYDMQHTQAAINKGRSGKFGNYPHQYNNYEKFKFTCPKSPYYEFPILANHNLFDGKTKPGPDRVVYDKSGNFCGCITHTGAKGNAFKQCQST